MPEPNEKLGALWLKTSDRGDYFSGEVEIEGTKHKLIVFQNGFKDADNKPDWIIYKSKPRTAQ